jgi:hypothetical protein
MTRPTLAEARSTDKAVDAAQTAIDGFWARPSSSGDLTTDLENYVPGLAKRIGWTGTDAELQEVLEPAIDYDFDTDARRNPQKLLLRGKLAGKLDTEPVGDDAYLPYRSLSNEDAVAQLSADVAVLTSGKVTPDRDKAQARAEEIRDMLLARVPGNESSRHPDQQFRERIEEAVRLTTANPRRAREQMDLAVDATPTTPDYVTPRQVARAADPDDGKMSQGDLDNNESAVFGAAKGTLDLDGYGHTPESRAQFRDYAEKVAPKIGYTGDLDDLTTELVDVRTMLTDPNPLTGEVDVDAEATAFASEFVAEHLGDLPRTERADGTPLAGSGELDPVHYNMAKAAVDGFKESGLDHSRLGEYADYIAPRIGYDGNPEYFRDMLDSAVLQELDGQPYSVTDFADGISESLPQPGGEGLAGQVSRAKRARYLDGAPFGEQVPTWGLDEPGFGTVKANNTHVFRDTGAGWEQRSCSGTGNWTAVPDLPPSARLIQPSKAADILGGHCINCGRVLSDSTRHGGYGPECAKKVS